jgi:hypothetical protein
MRQNRAGRLAYSFGVLVFACVVAYCMAIGLVYVGMGKHYAGIIAAFAWGVIICWLGRPA